MPRRAIDPTLVGHLRQMWRALPHVLKQIFGAPDYAAYLAHCRRAGHPPRLTEKQFVEEFFAAKDKRMRCC